MRLRWSPPWPARASALRTAQRREGRHGRGPICLAQPHQLQDTARGLANNWGEEFCRAVYRAEFGEGRRIDDSDLLAALLAGWCVDPAPALSAAQSPEIKSRLRRQSEEAQRLGLFGAPSFVTKDGEIFWGNDRLAQALAWARGTSTAGPAQQR